MRLIDADTLIKYLNDNDIEFDADINYAIRVQPTIPQFGEWISVTDKLPDAGDRILIAVRLSGHEPVQLDEVLEDGCEIYLDSGYTFGSEVTHWMPLPEPPEEGETNETD